jgi:hypothetical protein
MHLSLTTIVFRNESELLVPLIFASLNGIIRLCRIRLRRTSKVATHLAVLEGMDKKTGPRYPAAS